MKILQTKSFKKIAKSKYPKSETEPYNPWAVCNKSTGGKKESPEKFERCVHHIKDQNRQKNKGKKKSKEDKTKPIYEGIAYTPALEEQYVEKSKQKGRRPLADRRNKGNMSDREWLKLLEQDKRRYSFVIEAKKKKDEKWMQDAVKKPGSFTEYCGGNVTDECVQRGKNSPDKKTRQRANLADTFRSVSKKKKKKKSSEDVKKKINAQMEGRYERVVFLQGDEALRPLEILDEQGERAALEYLKQWHYPGEHMKEPQLAAGSSDRVFKEGPYIMSYNESLSYIGLEFDTGYDELGDSAENFDSLQLEQVDTL